MGTPGPATGAQWAIEIDADGHGSIADAQLWLLQMSAAASDALILPAHAADDILMAAQQVAVEQQRAADTEGLVFQAAGSRAQGDAE